MSSPPVLPPWVCANGSGRVRSIRARRIAAGFLVLAALLPLLLVVLATDRAAAQFPIRQLQQYPGAYGPGPGRPVSGPVNRPNQPATPVAPHPAVARIVVPENDGVSYGSGTLVDSRGEFGLVITNWHVIRDAAGPIMVEFADGFKSPGEVAKTDKDWDLAALSIRRPNATPVAVTANAPQPGEMLTIAGYGSGDYRMSSGQCTQYLAPGVEFPYEMVELAAEARQGDSGGPIFNQQGELAGVLFGSGPGYTSGSYGGRVLRFLATVVPGGMPGNDGQTSNTAVAMQPGPAPSNLAPSIGGESAGTAIVAGPPPQATALHQSITPVGPESRWRPPANELPGEAGALTPAAPADPGSLLSPPSRDLVSDRFDDPVLLGSGDVDPKAAVVPDRLATRGLSSEIALAPRAGTSSLAASADINSAPPDQLLAAAWQKIGGPSVLDQAKTILAAIGVLAIIVLFWRVSRRVEPEMEAD